MENINPLQLLKEELDSDDIASRVNTIHKIPIVATLMSPDIIKNTLIPYLDSLIKKEDDEVVFAITQQLGNIAPLLGTQHTIILQYLENLCAHEETVVRQRAVDTISKLLSSYSDNEINNFIIPLIIRLSSNEGNFTCRVSAALLMCNVYHRAGTNKQKIRQKFMDISNQQMLLLQRVTAMKIPQMCKVYEKQYVISDLISILKHRSTDQQDQIRVLAIQSFKSISKVLTRDQNKTFILPLIIQAAQDKSWRVRLALSKNFTDITESFGKQVGDMSLIQTFGNLLKDPQVDVKIQAVKSLISFVKIISHDKVSVLLPQVMALGKDPLSIARSLVGGVISNMVSYLSKDQAYQNIQPLIKQLIKDDNQEVRKGGIMAACKFIQALGADTIGSLYGNLKQASEDPKWRVRLQLIKNIADVSLKIQNSETFTKYFQPLYLTFLKDRASAIRKQGVESIHDLGRIYGNGWLSSFVAKLTEILQKQSSYHFKITAIYCLKQVCLLNTSDLLEKCVTSIFKASLDPVPNVREVCVKCLRDIGKRWQKNPIKDSIKKHLSGMKDDPDKEVREKAIQINSMFN